MDQRRVKRLMLLCGVFMAGAGAVPLWWSVAHLLSPWGSNVFMPWLGVLSGSLAVLLGAGFVLWSLSRRPVRLSRRRSTYIVLAGWPVAGALILAGSWDDPTSAGVALLPILVAFPVGAFFEQPQQEQRYARSLTAHPDRARYMIVAGAIGGALSAVMSVVTIFLGDLGLVGTAVGFTVMMVAYALGHRADLKDLATGVPPDGSDPGSGLGRNESSP